jgi:acetyl esterase
MLARVRRANHTPLHQQAVAPARAAYAAAVGVMALPPAPVAHVQDLSLPLPDGPRPARLWRDRSEPGQPVLLYFHGGGFVVGGLDTCHAFCQTVARLSGAAVLAVDYRKCPEHPLRAAFDDAWDALLWLHREGASLGLDGQRLAVGGDSAGGTLAATTALQARDAGLPLALQAMFYPMVQARMVTPSYEAYGDNTLLDRQVLDWFERHSRHLTHPPLRQPWHREPLYAPSHAKLAPAWIGLAECDMLTSEGQAYEARLRQADVPVSVQVWPGMIHDFINMGRFLPAAHEAATALAEAVAEALGTRPQP